MQTPQQLVKNLCIWEFRQENQIVQSPVVAYIQSQFSNIGTLLAISAITVVYQSFLFVLIHSILDIMYNYLSALLKVEISYIVF